MKKILFILFLLPIISKAEIIHGTVAKTTGWPTLITIIVFSCVKDSATKEEKKQKFYRVVQVDKNGKKTYTPILRLNK